MNLTAVLDHTALAALYRADPFLTGLYIEASRGTGRVLVPSLAVLAAERRTPGAGRHAASLRFAEQVPFGVAHATDAMDWPDVAEPVAHAAAVVRQAVRAGEPATLLSLDPVLYAVTGVTPLDPT
uniref:PIN domain-containing protein n=1 Tax=Streptomyces sp. SAT1 TaxID=1849967 RepID=UPI0007F9BB94|nr:PIN domain-containing protein [Streptomyces sp. SAT1]ANO42456.1 hypothetical protein A8713_034945 [Streptomyces sp. SAT1]